MKVVLIGSGNTATVLGRMLSPAGHEVMQVFSRNKEHAASLADELGCPWSDDWSAISREAGLYLVALSDNALLSLGERLRLPGRLVVHTAGAIPKSVLLGVSANSGVLYPLQSLRKEIRAFPGIPLLVDGNGPDDLEKIAEFARTLSDRVEVADDDTRLKLHLAGVLVNNFSNHLYALASDFCKREGLDFDLLLPLIQETAGRLSLIHPREAQTGPAVRGDGATLRKHLELLDNYQDIRDLYNLFAYQIQVLHGKK